MSTRQSESAGPALRGFRLQMLYTLARLTEPRATLQATLWPEGVEDLAIFDDQDMLREAIQIKAHTAPLTLSELVSRRGNGLMQRAVETARKHPECRVRLLSFGPELQDAWDGTRAARDRVTGKLRDAGLSPSDVSIPESVYCREHQGLAHPDLMHSRSSRQTHVRTLIPGARDLGAGRADPLRPSIYAAATCLTPARSAHRAPNSADRRAPDQRPRSRRAGPRPGRRSPPGSASAGRRRA